MSCFAIGSYQGPAAHVMERIRRRNPGKIHVRNRRRFEWYVRHAAGETCEELAAIYSVSVRTVQLGLAEGKEISMALEKARQSA